MRRLPQQVIARCCELKAQVVAADERETTGLRPVLNYGHTFAHAFEAIAGYGQLLHGEAVSIPHGLRFEISRAFGSDSGGNDGPASSVAAGSGTSHAGP